MLCALAGFIKIQLREQGAQCFKTDGFGLCLQEGPKIVWVWVLGGLADLGMGSNNIHVWVPLGSFGFRVCGLGLRKL